MSCQAADRNGIKVQTRIQLLLRPENEMIAVLCCVYTRTGGTFDDMIYNDLLTYAAIVLNGNTKMYSEAANEYGLMDQIT